MAIRFWSTAHFFWDGKQSWSSLYQDMIDLSQAAEDLGFEGISMPENHFQNYVTNPSSLMFSAVVASKTKTLKIQPGVIVLPYYNPLLISSEIAALTHMAPGRIDIGIARGGSRPQFDRVGVNYDDVREIYEESLEIIRRSWVEDDMTHEGRFFNFPATTIVPKPYEEGGPALWVAAQSVPGVRKVAEDGLNLLTMPNFGNFEPHGDFKILMGEYNKAVEESGKPRGGVMMLRHAWVAETEAQAKKFLPEMLHHWNHYNAFVKNSGDTSSAEGRLQRRVDDQGRTFVKGGFIIPETASPNTDNLFDDFDDPIMTTPDRFIERVKGYEEMGVDRLSLHQTWGQPIGDVIKNMEFIAKEVFPEFEEKVPDAEAVVSV
ncbi:LLM class flavin-dependent oxidoreductase [bacterium RCC_150]